MPLSSSFMDELYSSWGVNPQDSDPLSALSNIDLSSYNDRGLRDYQLGNVWQDSAPGFFGGLANLGQSALWGIAETTIGLGESGLDLFSNVFETTNPDNPGGRGVLGYGAEIAEGLREDLSSARETWHRPSESGGGPLEEIQHDWNAGKLGEVALDAGEFLAEQGLQMAALGGFGKLLGVGAGLGESMTASRSLMAGYAADTYQNNYNELTENPTDSRLTAVLASAASAGAQSYLEKVGFESMLGKGAMAALVRSNLSGSRAANFAAGSLVNMLAEGGTETAQQAVDILARNAHSLEDASDWSEWASSVLTKEAGSEMANAFFGGALFGGLIGGPSWAADVKAAKEIAAAGTSPNPDKVLFDGLQKPPIDTAKSLMVERAEAGDIDAADMLAETIINTEADSQATLEEIVENTNNQAIQIAGSITESDKNDLSAIINQGIQGAGLDASQKVFVLRNIYQGLAGASQGGTAMGEEGNISEGMIATPQEVATVLGTEALHMGLNVSNRNLSDPASIDWDAWAMEEAEKAADAASTALAPLQEVSTPQPSNESITQERVKKKIGGWFQRAEKEAAGEDYLDALIDSGATIDGIANEFFVNTYPNLSQKNKAKFHSYVKSLTGQKVGDVIGSNADGSPWVAKSLQDIVSFSGELDTLSGEERGLAVMMDYANKNAPKAKNVTPSAPTMLESPMEQGSSGPSAEFLATEEGRAWYPEQAPPPPMFLSGLLGRQQGKVAVETDLSGVGEDLERRITREFQTRVFDLQQSTGKSVSPEERAAIRKAVEQDVQSRGITNEFELIGEALLDPGTRTSGELDILRGKEAYTNSKERIELGKARDINAFVGSAVRKAMFDIWSNGDLKDIDLVGQTLINERHENADRFLATVVPKMGMGNAGAEILNQIVHDSVAKRQIYSIISDTARKVMSPIGMLSAMRGAGMSDLDAKLGLSVMDAMASTWAKRNTKSKLEWWNRLGDWAVSSHGEKGGARGHAAAPIWMSAGPRVGRGLMALFHNDGRKVSPRTVAHETIHLLRSSGLLYEMLSEEQLAALEEFVGERLFNDDGTPNWDMSVKGDERLAVGFEKFLIENEAPTPELRGIFQSLKEYFAAIVREVLGAIGINIQSITSPHLMSIIGGNYAYHGDKIKIKWNELNLSKEAAGAYYALLTADPVEVKNPHIHGTKPQLLAAVEKEASNATGLNAKGWLTSTVAKEATNPDGTLQHGWTPESGVAPTMEQWKSMHGLVNDSANGLVTATTMADLEEQRRSLGDWAGRVLESADQDPPVQTYEDQARQKQQDALASEGTLVASNGYDFAMDHFAEMLISGEKDAFNLARKLDPSDPQANIAMLQTFSSKMLNWKGLWNQGKYLDSIKEAGNDILSAAIKNVYGVWKAYERGHGNYGAAAQELYRNFGLIREAEHFNNLHAVGQLAKKVVENPPAIWDPVNHKWNPIPGAKSWVQIFSNFEHMAKAFYAELGPIMNYKGYKEFHESLFRDLKMYTLARAQIELDTNVKRDLKIWEAAVAEWQQAVDSGTVEGAYAEQAGKPRKPRMPRVDPNATAIAQNVLRLINARYGKHVGMFHVTSAELTYWSNLMKLEKLRSANMISDKAHADMTAKRTAYIPFYRMRNAVLDHVALNPKLDESVYEVLDYLKHDLSMKVEDPIAALLRSAQAVEILTQRQAAKNAIGDHLLKNVRWWDPSDSGIEILSIEHQVTKDEWDALPADSPKRTKEVQIRNKSGLITGSRTIYYAKKPMDNFEFKKFLSSARERAGLKGKDVSVQDIQSVVEHQVFAFYPEPGKPMYIRASNPDLARAFYHMNNPQALYLNSWIGNVQKWLGKPIDPQADAITKTAYHTAKLATHLVVNGNRILRPYLITTPKFIYNMLFRDIPGALVRSRHGLTLMDIFKAFRESALLMFPSVRELNPGNHILANDSAYGIGPYSGIVAMDHKGGFNTEAMSLLLKDRVQLMESAKNGSRMAKVNLAWNDFLQYLSAEGLDKNILQVAKENALDTFGLLTGKSWNKESLKNMKSNYTYAARSIFGIPKGTAGFFATMVENAPRLAERKLSMSEDMGQYPSLTRFYNPEMAIQGKLLAGFNGRTHRALWEKHKRLLKANPDHVVPESALPVQFSATERDYSTAHITLPFHNKGSLTSSIEPVHLFYNASSQDLYSNLKIIGQHSLVQRAITKATGKKSHVAPEAQMRLDMQAYAWLAKSFFYMTIPALAQYAIYSGDDDDDKEWQAQSFIEKMSYWHIPMPNGKKFRLATGLGLSSLLFHDLPMAMALELNDKDPRGMRKWAERFFDSTPLGLVMNVPMAYMQGGPKGAVREAAFQTVAGSEMIKPMAEYAFNWDEFRNAPIGAQESLYRGDPTEIGREKQNALVNGTAKVLGMQPKEAAFLWKRYFPGYRSILPEAANMAMEGAHMGTEDAPSNQPVAGGGSVVWPRFTARDPWGMGNEFVQDLMRTYNEAARQRITYESKPETQRAMYLAEHPLIQDKVWSQLLSAAKRVAANEKERKLLLEQGRALDAQAIERSYTLLSMETMRNVLTQSLGGN